MTENKIKIALVIFIGWFIVANILLIALTFQVMKLKGDIRDTMQLTVDTSQAFIDSQSNR